ncbi:MAG: 4Fe-4S dicluster domain-containing protein [Magnetococcales bacterium]|nr:4Fe-4S dicluster domain-containing protein [Magnetococcales bacterium]
MTYPRTLLHYDVIIVGAGPAGLAAALRLAQDGVVRKICVLEKSARIGGHLLSGALLDPNDLTSVVPDWQQRKAPLGPVARRDDFLFLSARQATPLPNLWDNRGHCLVSLGTLCRWLAARAEELGVEIYPGFAATRLLWNHNQLEGVGTGDHGQNREGRPLPGFQAGIDLKAPVTILAEGCRGSLARQVIERLALDANRPPQTYALGFKELWEVPAKAEHQPGDLLHTVGWPLKCYGGGFLYQVAAERIAAGFVVGLDYRDPQLDPFAAFQNWKSHPQIAKRLQNGRPIGFGARTLVEGGWSCLPQLTFAGGLLVGDAAGFLNAARLKGIGNALQSGVAAALAVAKGDPTLFYPQAVQTSSWGRALAKVRNVRPGFRWGILPGLLNAGLEKVTHGHTPWTLRWKISDRSRLQKAMQNTPPPHIADGRVESNRSFWLGLSALTHREDQPLHIALLDPRLPLEAGRTHYANPETRYCPAGVFQLKMPPDVATPTFRMQTANCLHCKCCDIKDPFDNIRWTPPEGGSGPDYGE